MKAAIFQILIPGPIKTYDKPLLTFLKHLLAILLLQASFDVYELTECGISPIYYYYRHSHRCRGRHRRRHHHHRGHHH